MPYGPYSYRDGNKYVFGSDGRWWLVTSSHGGDDYGYPVAAHSSPRHHSHHAFRHSVSSPAQRASACPSRRVASAGVYDPWQGNDYAHELFQGQGAQYFIGANHMVVRTTEIAALAYTAAFLAPQIVSALGYTASRAISPAARWTLNQAGAFGPSINRLFWSGAASGGAAAVRYGSQFSGYVGQTLEETPLGRAAVWAQSYFEQSDATREVWDWLSTGFAEGAAKSATYFQGQGGYEGRVWLEIEWPILQQRFITVTKISNP